MNNIKHFKLRTPIEIADWVAKEAKENKRSLNAQIIYCIEQIKKATDLTDQSVSVAFSTNHSERE